MKKTLFLLTFILIATVAFAQKGRVTSALNFKDSGRLDRALESIEEAVDESNPRSKGSIDWPRTWEVRGEIFQAIGQSNDANVKKLSDDPLTEALKSYEKALELDTRGRFANSIKIKLTLLVNDLTNQAVEAFNTENFKKAMVSFEQILEIQDLPVMRETDETVDTVIVYNAALAAFSAGEFAKAVQFSEVAAKYGYNEGRTYLLLASAHLEKTDTLAAINALQEGLNKYPTDNGILVELTNIYITTGKTQDAMTYLELAIEQDPDNETFYFVQGSLLDGFGYQDRAIESYMKAIEKNEEYWDALYNLGALFYNNGVKQFEIASEVPPNDNVRYEAELKKADDYFAKALPYMERCLELRPKDPYALESLRNLYWRLQTLDKYEEIIKIIDEM